MVQELIHVYLMPGMAASPKIFEHIKLPENQFEIHLLEWQMPKVNESLSDYALRLSKKIKHTNVVLLGVSFGGVLVQEMSRFVKLRKLIIVSSVKTMNELPKRMIFAKTTKAYALIPTQLASKIEVFEKYAFGATMTKRLELYKKYLSVNDSKYLSWAIKEMVCWERQDVIPGIIHIHGDKDPVFPIKYIKDCIVIKNGTHIAIINKYKWFNKNLPALILES
ncbi:alpha/beta hydrolase [Algibacter sp.]|uniref:alpha/beta hydrolase n=1 Tax=Algibacter sp. TaxID=1872428 RepID=UPI003C778BDD